MITTGGVFGSLIIFVAAGIFAGLVCNVIYMTVKLTKNNFIVVFTVDFIATMMCGAILYLICFKYFYADINFYFIVCFLCGIIFELIFIKNLVANPVKVVYNKIRNKFKIKGKS